jgi:hypothetical protein
LGDEEGAVGGAFCCVGHGALYGVGAGAAEESAGDCAAAGASGLFHGSRLAGCHFWPQRQQVYEGPSPCAAQQRPTLSPSWRGQTFDRSGP